MSRTLKAPALDPSTLEPRTTSGYPAPFAEAVAGRAKRALGDPLGLTHFGVNLTTLPPGAWSSQRHFHTLGDELVYVLEGEVVLVTDQGEQVLGPGDVAGFPAGTTDGHHLVNRGEGPARYLEIGDRVPGDEAGYPDIDLALRVIDGRRVFTHADGTPY